MQEPLSLPEQIDEAINYIKTLESNMQKLKQKRDNLKIGRKRSYELCSSTRSAAATSTAKSPQIQIQWIGSTLEVVLGTGLHNQFIFYDIIRILDQEQADVVHASFSASGDSILHLVRAEVQVDLHSLSYIYICSISLCTYHIFHRSNTLIPHDTS